MEALATDQFWGDLYVAHFSRAVTDHLSHWLQKVQGPKNDIGHAPVVELACSKATFIMDSFHALVLDDSSADLWDRLFQIAGRRDCAYWQGRAVQF
eukprot:7306705-Pyramimonas_sp.AAC.1